MLKRNKNKLLFILPLLFFLLLSIIILAFLHQKNQNNLSTKLQNNQPVILPEFNLPTLYNSNINFSNSDLLGKYSIINIFASWCASCVKEHQILMQIAESKKIDIYGIAWMDIANNTKKYLEKYGNPYLKIGIDNKGEFTKLLSIKATPESFIIDNYGRIIYYQQGVIDQQFIEFLSRIVS